MMSLRVGLMVDWGGDVATIRTKAGWGSED